MFHKHNKVENHCYILSKLEFFPYLPKCWSENPATNLHRYQHNPGAAPRNRNVLSWQGRTSTLRTESSAAADFVAVAVAAVDCKLLLRMWQSCCCCCCCLVVEMTTTKNDARRRNQSRVGRFGRSKKKKTTLIYDDNKNIRLFIL